MGNCTCLQLQTDNSESTVAGTTVEFEKDKNSKRKIAPIGMTDVMSMSAMSVDSNPTLESGNLSSNSPPVSMGAIPPPSASLAPFYPKSASQSPLNMSRGSPLTKLTPSGIPEETPSFAPLSTFELSSTAPLPPLAPTLNNESNSHSSQLTRNATQSIGSRKGTLSTILHLLDRNRSNSTSNQASTAKPAEMSRTFSFLHFSIHNTASSNGNTDTQRTKSVSDLNLTRRQRAKSSADAMTTSKPKNGKSRMRSKSTSTNRWRSNSVDTTGVTSVSKIPHTMASFSERGSRNASIFIREEMGSVTTALERCVSENNVNMLRSILDQYHKCRKRPHYFMRFRNGKDQTLLMKASLLGHFPMVQFLVDRFLLFKNALFEQVEPMCGSDVSGIILEYMGDWINYESKVGKTALVYACCSKHKVKTNVAQFLCESGAKVSITTNNVHHKSPIIHAIELKNLKLLKILLNYGADVNVQDRNGYTALMYAARYNEPDLVTQLLSYGADPLIHNVKGQNAADLAREDQCWATLLQLEPMRVPTDILPGAASTQKRTRWGRWSYSVSLF